MLRLRRRPGRKVAGPAAGEPAPPPRAVVSATTVDPERPEDVAAWLVASGTTSSSFTE